MWLELSLIYLAFTALSLSMHRHYQALFKKPPNPWIRRALRALGWTSLALSFVSAPNQSLQFLGVVAWFGLFTAAGLSFVILLAYSPIVALGLGLLPLAFTTSIGIITIGLNAGLVDDSARFAESTQNPHPRISRSEAGAVSEFQGSKCGSKQTKRPVPKDLGSNSAFAEIDTR